MFAQRRPQKYGPDMWADHLGICQVATRSCDDDLQLFARIRAKDTVWHHISRYTTSGQLVLDVGAGMGQWVWFLEQMGYSCVGLDYSRSMVKVCGERFPNSRWICGEMAYLPVSDESFDCVISWGVIEHDSNGPSRAIREFRRILKPGGICFLTVPLDTPLQRWSHSIQYGNSETSEFFEYFFTPEDMKGFVEESGLRCVLAQPIAKHHAVLFPRSYTKAVAYPGFPRNIISRCLDFVAKTTKKSYSMLLVVCDKSWNF